MGQNFSWPEQIGHRLDRQRRQRAGDLTTKTEEAWENKTKWYLEDRYLKDLNRIDGELMEFEWTIFQGFTTLHSRRDSNIYERSPVWTWAVQINDHLHVNVQRHCMGRAWKHWKVSKSQLKLRIMLTYSRADIGHFWDLDQRTNGTQLVNLTEIGTELLKEWWWTLQKALIPYFVPLAPWKEENLEAKKRERSLSTSTVAKHTLNWFFAQWFL